MWTGVHVQALLICGSEILLEDIFPVFITDADSTISDSQMQPYFCQVIGLERLQLNYDLGVWSWELNRIVD